MSSPERCDGTNLGLAPSWPAGTACGAIGAADTTGFSGASAGVVSADPAADEAPIVELAVDESPPLLTLVVPSERLVPGQRIAAFGLGMAPGPRFALRLRNSAGAEIELPRESYEWHAENVVVANLPPTLVAPLSLSK